MATPDEKTLHKHGDPSESKGEAGTIDELLKEMGLNPDDYPTMDEKRAAANVGSEEDAQAALKRLKDRKEG